MSQIVIDRTLFGWQYGKILPNGSVIYNAEMFGTPEAAEQAVNKITRTEPRQRWPSIPELDEWSEKRHET